MKSDALVSALITCANRLKTPKGVYVLHHGVNFAESLPVRAISGLDIDVTLAESVGMDIKVKPTPFAAGAKGPTALSVRQHIRWMLDNVPGHDDFNKRCRWVGFAAGAAARAGLRGRYYRNDLFDARDMPALISLAESHATPQHYFAHTVLGFWQGWLWADGQSSVEDFRRMNKFD